MKFLMKFKNSKITAFAVKTLIAFAISGLLFLVDLSRFEAFFYDLQMRLRPQQTDSKVITLITIDQKTQAQLERVPDVNDHLRLLKILRQHAPQQVLYNLDPVDIIGSYESLEVLADSLVKNDAIVLAQDRFPVKGREEDFILLPPLQNVKVMSAPITHDKSTFAKDDVSRRFVYTFRDQKLLHANIGEAAAKRKSTDGVFQVKRTDQGLINFHPTGTFDRISFIDLINNNYDPQLVKNRILILGYDNKSNVNYYSRTPYSKDIVAMPNLEVHANIIETVYLNKAIIKAPKTLNIILCLLVSLITVFIVLSLRPAQGIAIILLLSGALLLVSYSLYSFFEVWTLLAQPLISIFICYYFFIPYRLIVENRRSWEYYEKNNILLQVEELKSNFMKMMSHDLKTPLARIQGMSETVLRETNNMNDQQIKAVESIKASSEELTEFIGSILNLNRIESKEVKLDLKSKDINQILEKVINKCQYLANRKNIELIPELEPLFSTKVDESLLVQVFTNLVENAIKYSPENTKVLITSEEEDGKIIVQVADQGNGIPLSEQDKVFSKFYRSKDATTSSTKGSGLGLYLSNYFVELHGGKINLESDTQLGSTFSVELPMN